MTFDGFDGDCGFDVPVAGDALSLGFQDDAESSFAEYVTHQQPAVSIHNSTAVTMRDRMTYTQWRKPVPQFGGTKKILPSPQIQTFGGRRETHCFLELNN